MLKVLVFSKDRPMQLQAYLESLMHYSGLQKNAIYVIYKDKDDYVKLRAGFPDIHWMKEQNGFDSTLRDFCVKSLRNNDLLLTGCDDVVYFRHFGLLEIVKFMQTHSEIGCFSLRLGTNIDGCPHESIQKEEGFIKWFWRNKQIHHSYFFELMSTIYWGSLFKDVVNHGQGAYRIPNDLEGRGHHYSLNNPVAPCMASCEKSCAAAIDCNRTQNLVPNRIQASQDLSIEVLRRWYTEGKRIKWQKIEGISPGDCFIGDKYLVIE